MKFKSIDEFNRWREGIVKKYQKKKKIRIKVCITGCRANGSLEIFKAFKKEIRDRKLKNIFEIVPTGCQKFCTGAPVVSISNPDVMYQKVRPSDVPVIVNSTLEGKVISKFALKNNKFFEKQKIKVLEKCGEINPLSIEEYIWKGGFSAFEKVLSRFTPEYVIDKVKKSKLRGRGGAGFPTGLKWELTRKSKGDIKYLICNGDEGDPGAFMDRTLLEGVPFQVIEGILIGAYAIGAKEGYFYVRAEYPVAIEHLKVTIEKCYNLGLLGKNILGTGFSFDLSLKEGAGAFVCGEETALIASIEGKRGMPRPRPPFPAQKGLWGKPTCINNVETFANIPIILKEGGENFAKTGTEKSGGTKIFSLAGKIKNTGLVEVPLGITLGEVIFEIGGGALPGRKIKGVQTGGPSGGCIPVEKFKAPVDYETLASLGSIMGSGGMIAIDDKVCVVDFARYFLQFVQNESCGKCVPCRIGTKRMLEILEKITIGKGEISDIDKLLELGQIIKEASLCGLGQTAPNPVLTTIKYFKEEYLEHILLNYCRAGQCKELVYAPCENACPGEVKVPDYIQAIREKNFIEAYKIICQDIPFPSLCGRACYAPCESVCRREEIDEAVGIRNLKKFISEYAWKRNLSVKDFMEFMPSINKKVAVIGGGVCGLTCAWMLSQNGVEVDIYEKENYLGGTVKTYIPEFRIPSKVIEKEVSDIINGRIKVHYRKILGENLSLEALEKNYNAVFISTGATVSLDIGFRGKNIYYGLDFLRKVKEKRKIKIGKKVGIIGGGNVAIDCARVALRKGTKEVYIIYRRTEEYMPAHRSEIKEAKKEGIKFIFLAGPEKIEKSTGKVKLLLRKNEFQDEYEKDGRRKIRKTEQLVEIELDTLIIAIGQRSNIKEILGDIKINKFTLQTERKKLFVGGDFLRGPSSIIQAIGDGKKGAYSILEFLKNGRTLPHKKRKIEIREEEYLKKEEPLPVSAQKPDVIPLSERKGSFREIEKTFSTGKAIKEAKRCLQCHLEK